MKTYIQIIEQQHLKRIWLEVLRYVRERFDCKLLLLTTKTQFLQSKVNFLVLTKILQGSNFCSKYERLQLSQSSWIDLLQSYFFSNIIWFWHFLRFSRWLLIQLLFPFFFIPLTTSTTSCLIDLLQEHK